MSAFRRTLLLFGLAYAGLSVAGGAVLAERALHRPRRPITADERVRAAAAARAWGAHVEDVSIGAADASRLRGWLFTPAAASGHSVIVLHGIVANRASMLDAARLFVASRYRTLVIDARGHGDSGGELATYGALEADDLRRWIAWMRGNEGSCVYTFGQSLGAAHALEAADAPGLCAVVAQSAYASLREITFDRIGQQAGTGSWLGRVLLRPGVEFAFLYVKARYGVDLGTASAAGAVARPGAPILLIHGLDDDNVPIRHAGLIAGANPGRVTEWLIPGGGHGTPRAAGEAEYAQRIAAFLAAHRRVR